jgi:hypothetical protein
MTARIGALALAALLSASVVACEKTGEKEQKAEGVANRQAEEAQQEAFNKSFAVQAQADQKIAAARLAFEKSREEYRHSRQADLDQLNLKITDLEILDRTANAKTKAALDTRLPAIHAQRDAFTSDLRSLQYATPATWDDAKVRLDTEWESLEKSVSESK